MTEDRSQLIKSFIPLIYLTSAAVIAGAFHWMGVAPEMTALIIGAALTRVKVAK